MDSPVLVTCTTKMQRSIVESNKESLQNQKLYGLDLFRRILKMMTKMRKMTKKKQEGKKRRKKDQRRQTEGGEGKKMNKGKGMMMVRGKRSRRKIEDSGRRSERK